MRKILDDGGLIDVLIFASGGLDEEQIAILNSRGAPIDGFGVGTSLTTSSDAAALDCAYKLQEYAGRPKRKRSTGKATWPGRKQVYRRYTRDDKTADDKMEGDILTLDGDAAAQGDPLLRPVMRDGRRVTPAPSLDNLRGFAARQLARLPKNLRQLTPAGAYPVETSRALIRLAEDVDAHQR